MKPEEFSAAFGDAADAVAAFGEAMRRMGMAMGVDWASDPPHTFPNSDLHAFDSEDPYRVLGVSREATPEQVSAAYRKLAREYHPDHGGDRETMVRINQAYEALRQ